MAQNICFHLSQSGEIFPWTPIQKVAHTQEWYLGVANMRGSLFGVADFTGFVNATKATAEQRIGIALKRVLSL